MIGHVWRAFSLEAEPVLWIPTNCLNILPYKGNIGIITFDFLGF